MKVVIFDTETDGLLDTVTKLHCIQLGDADGDDVVVYGDNPLCDRPLAEGLERLRAADRVVGHHFIGYDWHIMERFCPGVLRRSQVWDTLVAVRLYDPEQRSNSLDECGKRLGVHKGSFNGPWDTLTQTMVDYARQDIVVTRALYRQVEPIVSTWGESVQLEHDVAWAIKEQMECGFGFDVAAAQRLDVELRVELAEVAKVLQEAFPPKRWEFIPKVNNKVHGYKKGVPVTKFEVFNPGSRQQAAERLVALGWEPQEYGKDGVPKLDEKVLASLPYPEAKPLANYYRIDKMLGMLSDGKNGWLKLVRDGRIYGRVNSNGACTGRMTHMAPNVAQADTDPRMRALFIPRPGWVLVGCDAEGIEARMLSHYVYPWDKGRMIEMLVNGDKSKGTDVHSSNAKAIKDVGYPITRNGAKTTLYAALYGAGDYKLGTTVLEDLREQGKECKHKPVAVGKRARAALSVGMQGYDKLTDAVKAKAKSPGTLKGLDGRIIRCRSQHSALNTLLQGGGAIVMKKALQIFMERHRPDYFEYGLCANVHDEVQMEAPPAIAADLGKAFADCIVEAGIALKIRCPLAGEFKVGPNWSKTH